MDHDLTTAMQLFQTCLDTRDVIRAEQVLDEDFALVLVQPAKAVVPRERWLALLPDYVVHSLTCSEQVTDVDGDLAVSLHRDEMSATVLGEDRSGTFVISDTWRRTSQGWRLWRRHSTPLTAGPMPA